jgi:aconitate hydratase
MDMTLQTFSLNGNKYSYAKINKDPRFNTLPFSIKILLENLLRNGEDTSPILTWLESKGKVNLEINYKPARVLMQDFTGVPAVVDLAAMRDAVKKRGGDVKKINPLVPTHLVIDHSVQVDSYASKTSLEENIKLEMQRNLERYEFLKWGQNSFKDFSVVPPGVGICHQVNIENIAKVVWKNDKNEVYFDTCVGTDSHTTMVNGLGVLGWGVGGIEAESVMLGESISMLVPEVVGVKLIGSLKEGVTATDLVLTITQMLRKKGVVDKFVEFYGDGVKNLSLANRATIANMAPEYGATCGIFCIDEKTIDYLKLTGRSEEQIELISYYTKEQGVWGVKDDIIFTDSIELDLSSVEPSLAGPKRPQDKVVLSKVRESMFEGFPEVKEYYQSSSFSKDELNHGSVAIAAITSCTNTSNPSVLIAAGLLAKKAVEKGLTVKPFVKTSLAPGSRVVEDYLLKANLQQYLDKLGFNIVGFGCTTCIGNSGPLKPEIEQVIKEKNLSLASVLSGNRNFEGRVHPLVKANYLASPPLVVAYALAGTVNIDLNNEPIANGVYLKDIWPSNEEVESVMNQALSRQMFTSRYKSVYDGTPEWQAIETPKSDVYEWKKSMGYIENPPYFNSNSSGLKSIQNAKALLILGDSVTTDHISPAGDISLNSPAGEYLKSLGIEKKDFNSYGARRGSHSVMMRGTFANIRIKNKMADGKEGGYSKDIETGEVKSVYDIAMKWQAKNTPLIVFGGKEYGTGSSRDWAAKGTMLLGVKAVICESFERIHRSNLIGMGVVPFVFEDGLNATNLNIKGDEVFEILEIESLQPKSTFNLKANGKVLCKIIAAVNTQREIEYLNLGGIMQYVIKNLTAN